jgi:hypothetical protein
MPSNPPYHDDFGGESISLQTGRPRFPRIERGAMDARERELSDAVEEAYRGAVLVEYPNAHKTAAGIHDCDITKLKEGETCAFLGTDWKRAAEAAELKLHAEDAEEAAKVGRVHICNSNCIHEAAVPESQDGLPPLEVTHADREAGKEWRWKGGMPIDGVPGHEIHRQMSDMLMCRERQLIATRAELRVTRQKNQEMAKLVQNYQDLKAELAAAQSQIANLTNRHD